MSSKTPNAVEIDVLVEIEKIRKIVCLRFEDYNSSDVDFLSNEYFETEGNAT